MVVVAVVPAVVVALVLASITTDSVKPNVVGTRSTDLTTMAAAGDVACNMFIMVLLFAAKSIGTATRGATLLKPGGRVTISLYEPPVAVTANVALTLVSTSPATHVKN